VNQTSSQTPASPTSSATSPKPAMETLSGHHDITWLLTDIQDGVITSSPDNIVAHGGIQKWQGGLKLDGKTGWIEIDTSEGLFTIAFFFFTFDPLFYSH